MTLSDNLKLSARIMLLLNDGLIISSNSLRNTSASDKLLSSSDFSSSCFTELKGGSNFVTDRFFENSGFSFEIIGANRKIKIINTKKAKEKFNLLVIKRNLFLNNSIRGIIRMKSRVDNEASTKLKLRTANAVEVSLKNKLM